MLFRLFPKSLFLVITSGLIILSCAELKQAGRDIGHGTRDAAKAIGHGTRDAAKAIGHGTRDAVKAVGKGVKKTTESEDEDKDK